MESRSPYRHRAAGILGALACVILGMQVTGIPPARAVAPVTGPLELPAIPAAADCAQLVQSDVSGAVGAKTVVRSASTVDDHRTAPFCSVKIVVDDYARFELHLPVAAWTQRLLFGGGPGAQTASGVRLDQFATVSWEDLGRRQDEDVLANDYHGQVNAGYRGMHLQVLAAKALIARYYGRGPRFSYLNACSNPAREGMIEVQRFPEDFDGVGAGCPPINTTMNNGIFHAWGVLTNTGPDGKAILTADKLPILHDAVLAQCDAADGAVDGIVSEPFACHPSFAKIECRPGDNTSGCLTAAQIHVAAELYRGAHDAQGRRLTPGGVLPGSELAWTASIVPGGRFGGPEEDRTATTKAIRSHYSLPALPRTWRLSDLTFDKASFEATTKLSYLHDGTNPDLSGYAKAGHKLMLFMSLGDTSVLPGQVLLYWTALQQQMGVSKVATFARFYTLPGVYHCGGGDGPIIANLLVPLMAWVERGVAPGALPGVHVPRGPDGPPQGEGRPGTTPAAPDLTRSLYPYPFTARYVGTGSVREAKNFVEGPARPAPAWLADWPGDRFYKPGYMRWCTAMASSLDCRTMR